MVVNFFKSTFLSVVLVALIISVSGHVLPTPVSAKTISLTGTIRDFRDSHPDFENEETGLVTGIVQPTLGEDGKPVYSGCNCGATHGQAAFDQWYRDVTGVNMSQPLTIVLDNTITPDQNVYTFTDSTFFPIDNQLFGTQGGSNYHFTYELHTQFTYQGGEVFQFTSDDDLWVFINNQLVVDLGGIHGAEIGGVALDTLDLTVGETYNFDLFFAERHMIDSNLRIDISLVAKNMELDAGWHMISLPVVPESLVLSDVFPEAEVVYRYEHDVGYVSVQQHEELEVGKGYWILLDNPQSYAIRGTAITEYTIPLADRWYMIGGCTLPAQRIVTNGRIFVTYGYTPGIGYERLPESEPLEPGKGYWINFSNTSEGSEFTASTTVLKPEPIVPSGLVPVTKTGQTTSYAAEDDGDLQKGAAWPDPRFTDHQDGTVTDNLTGLMWTQDANMYGQRAWANALSECANCMEGGHNDWRLPNVRELHSLIDYGQYPALPADHPFTSVRKSWYWSSSTGAFSPPTLYAWYVDLSYGSVSYASKDGAFYVWCVRGGQ